MDRQPFVFDIDRFLTAPTAAGAQRLARLGLEPFLAAFRRAAMTLRIFGLNPSGLDEARKETARFRVLDRLMDLVDAFSARGATVALAGIELVIGGEDPMAAALATLALGRLSLSGGEVIRCATAVLSNPNANVESWIAASIVLQGMPGPNRILASRTLADLVNRHYPEALQRTGLTMKDVESGRSVAPLILPATDIMLRFICQDTANIERYNVD